MDEFREEQHGPASRKARFAAIDFIPPQLEKQIRSEGIKGDPK
jgi:hypothetical protein